MVDWISKYWGADTLVDPKRWRSKRDSLTQVCAVYFWRRGKKNAFTDFLFPTRKCTTQTTLGGNTHRVTAPSNTPIKIHHGDTSIFPRFRRSGTAFLFLLELIGHHVRYCLLLYTHTLRCVEIKRGKRSNSAWRLRVKLPLHINRSADLIFNWNL